MADPKPEPGLWDRIVQKASELNHRYNPFAVTADVLNADATEREALINAMRAHADEEAAKKRKPTNADRMRDLFKR